MRILEINLLLLFFFILILLITNLSLRKLINVLALKLMRIKKVLPQILVLIIVIANITLWQVNAICWPNLSILHNILLGNEFRILDGRILTVLCSRVIVHSLLVYLFEIYIT